MMNITEKLLLNIDWKQCIEEYLETYKDKEIFIWGLGNGANLVYKFLSEFNLDKNIIAFVDGLGNNSDNIKFTKPIVKSAEAIEVGTDGNAIIIVASMFLGEIQESLASQGIHNSKIDIRCFGMAKDYYTYSSEDVPTIVNNNIKHFEKVYELFNDELSRETYLGLVNSKLSLDNKHLIGLKSGFNQYFETQIFKLENDVLVDCGAYDGDTLDVFINETENSYHKYIAVEADPANYNKLNKNIHAKNYKNVETINLACWDKEDVLFFESNETAGQVVENSSIKINANKLDCVINEPISFLKMDIEGAEVRALKGAKNLIKKHHPILAICIYHQLEHYYEIPLLIKEYYNDYNFYVRHYTDRVDQETVFYAVPKHRDKTNQ